MNYQACHSGKVKLNIRLSSSPPNWPWRTGTARWLTHPADGDPCEITDLSSSRRHDVRVRNLH